MRSFPSYDHERTDVQIINENRALEVAIEPEVPLDVNEVEKPFKKLRKLLEKFPRHPSPDQVHDIRTRTRGVEAVLSALLLDRQRSGKQLLKQTTPVRKRAGKVRDMDVLTGFASTLVSKNDGDCLVQLLEHLGQKRFKAVRKLHKSVARRQASASKSLKRCSVSIKQRFGKDPVADWPEDAAARALKLSAELGNWPRLTAQNLHPFRLKVKELRNVLRLSGDGDALLEKLGEVKDAVGEWHDWTELAGIADKVLDHGQNCELREQIQAETTLHFKKALTLATRLREHYFNHASQKKSRQAQPLKKEVVQASAKLAA